MTSRSGSAGPTTSKLNAHSKVDGVPTSLHQNEEQEGMTKTQNEGGDPQEPSTQRGSVDSLTKKIKQTSKTRNTAEDSQKGTAKDAGPHPITKEGGQEVAAAPGHGDG